MQMLDYLRVAYLINPTSGKGQQPSSKPPEFKLRIEERNANTRLRNLGGLAFTNFIPLGFVVWEIF
jgi:hypothetical protein